MGKQKTKCTSSKGITLIALVITIIVLLILAGVSINMVVGENGILGKAQSAVRGTNEASAIEDIEMAWSAITTDYYSRNLQSQMKSDYYNLENLNRELGSSGIVSEFSYDVNGGAKLVYTSARDGNEYNIKVSQDGKVQIINMAILDVNGNKIDLNQSNVKNYLGKKVVNYLSDGNTYRLFYIDFEGKYGDAGKIYLKADALEAKEEYISEEYSINDSLIRNMNPMWNNMTNGEIVQDNEKIAAYLSDTTKWTAFCDNNKADYAIASPSLEMFIDSYNIAHQLNDNAKLACKMTSHSSRGYVISSDGGSTFNHWLQPNTIATDFNGMYCLGVNYWLCSPSDRTSGTNNDSLVFINGVDSKISAVVTYDTDGSKVENSISPIVSIKDNFTIQIEN